jgi:hypothetical protein
MDAIRAGLSSEKAGMDDIPLLFRLIDAPACNFVFELSACSFAKEVAAAKKSNKQHIVFIKLSG